MKINQKEFKVKGITYTIRLARIEDAKELSEVRLQIDGETDNLDREKGEDFLDTIDFERLIKTDTENERNLFLVAVSNNKIIGFSRCEGNHLKRFAHKVEFGICILKDYWNFGIGSNLLKESITWAETNGIKKINLNVLEKNGKAIKLYERFGFEIEGILRKDKILSDGSYYNTILMGRFNDKSV